MLTSFVTALETLAEQYGVPLTGELAKHPMAGLELSRDDDGEWHATSSEVELPDEHWAPMSDEHALKIARGLNVLCDFDGCDSTDVCCNDGPGGDWCRCREHCDVDHGPQPEGRVYYPQG